MLLTKLRGPRVAWRAPSCGVRFEETLGTIEEAVLPGRIALLAESSLSFYAPVSAAVGTAMRRIFAVLFSVAPFVAGAVAASSGRRDMRMLWMALAATVVARLVIAALPAKARRMPAAAVAFGAAAVAAAAVAAGFGARAVFGVVAIGIVLAGSATAGAALDRRAGRGTA